MSFPHRHSYRGFAAPPAGDKSIGFNWRATEGAVTDANPDQWAKRVNDAPYPTDFLNGDGSTRECGWESTPPVDSQIYDNSLEVVQLAGGQGASITWWRVDLTPGTWRINYGSRLYVGYTAELRILDGSAFLDDLIHSFPSTSVQANEAIDVHGNVTTPAVWLSNYATNYVDLVVSDKGLDTGLVFNLTGTVQYISHARCTELP